MCDTHATKKKHTMHFRCFCILGRTNVTSLRRNTVLSPRKFLSLMWGGSNYDFVIFFKKNRDYTKNTFLLDSRLRKFCHLYLPPFLGRRLRDESLLLLLREAFLGHALLRRTLSATEQARLGTRWSGVQLCCACTGRVKRVELLTRTVGCEFCSSYVHDSSAPWNDFSQDWTYVDG